MRGTTGTGSNMVHEGSTPSALLLSGFGSGEIGKRRLVSLIKKIFKKHLTNPTKCGIISIEIKERGK